MGKFAHQQYTLYYYYFNSLQLFTEKIVYTLNSKE